MPYKKTQLIFGFALRGLKARKSTSIMTRNAGIVVISNSTSTFVCLVQWIGWRLAIVEFTWSANLQEKKKWILWSKKWENSCAGLNVPKAFQQLKLSILPRKDNWVKVEKGMEISSSIPALYPDKNKRIAEGKQKMKNSTSIAVYRK